MVGLASGRVMTLNRKPYLTWNDRESRTGLPSVCWLSLAEGRKEKQTENATER